MTAATADLDVHLILRHGEEILLALRAGAAYGSGEWALPCGKVKPAEPDAPGESVVDAIVREAHEELGIGLVPNALAIGQTVHARHGTTDHFGVFFEARTWTGTPTNREPNKCDALRWFPVTKLPAPLMDYAAAGLRGYFTDPGGLTIYGDGFEPTTVGPAPSTTDRHDDHP
ncbi:NUDIX domain-containing protein [Streptomyces sp. NPDC005799]|uniref:NUDIX domain-containing protein n=1 Tax=Streptomyces sp. NPDC005799 TaxID=3154678 RepID=UPI0033C1C5F6